LANPSKLEALYERIEAWWVKLPLVRSRIRLQAFPSIVAMLAVYAGSLMLVLGAAAVFGADTSHGPITALVVVSWVMVFFVVMMVLVVRAARRAAEKGRSS
jgi:divalent metal cation (Fe/Co/Zn/Cd) transporter